MMNFMTIIYSDFLLKNMWWVVALASLLLLLGLFLGDHFISKKSKETSISPSKASLYLEALGGDDNVIDKKLEGSRIVLVLKDYGALNREKLREAGVTGFIQMSDKLTLVIKENAEGVYKKIFPSA